VGSATVGQTRTRATVQYYQDMSTFTANYEPYDDWDDSPARWAVSYYSGGARDYSIDDGHTGGNTIGIGYVPTWGSNQITYDALGRYVNAPALYLSTTASVQNLRL